MGLNSPELHGGIKMVIARWNGIEIAKSDRTVVVEGNHYFPREDVDKSLIEESDKHTTCPWKGEASYYTIVAGGKKNQDAAWYYPESKAEAMMVKDRIAFWKGVEVSEG
jgi:uncharacterized protein (DUF427 family)